MTATAAPPAGRPARRRRRLLARAVTVAALAAASLTATAATALASPAQAGAAHSSGPALGPDVYLFSPSMPQSQIQATVDQIAAQQVSNQFGTQRYALLFEPGTYGSAADPLIFQVGYYTEVAGLGAQPGDVVINGAVDSSNQCDDTGSCTALDNFWRSMSNLTINYTAPPGDSVPCADTAEFWAVSQASPMRRVDVNGGLFLFDYCTSPGYSSGGYIADSAFTGGVTNGTQQQFFARNSSMDSWSNDVWNQVFAGDTGAPPAQDFAAGGQTTTLATSPVTEEEPFLQQNNAGKLSVFVPAVRRNSAGPSWASGTEAGHAVPIGKFFIAAPSTPVPVINAALARGQNLILTPGVYNVRQPIRVSRANTVVLGLGFATLVPQTGSAALTVGNVPGVKLSGMIIDAGPVRSKVLLQVGATPGHRGSPGDPTLVQDVFFRIGGATPGQAVTSLLVNSSDVILDDIWAWRADHGAGVGWTDNVGDHGLVVNGSDVTAYGLFVEHYEQANVVWNGARGTDIFFQNELPYDPPSQAAWMENPSTDGFPAIQVTRHAAGFTGYGLGSYSFFDLGVPVFSASAFEVDGAPGVQLHDLLTVFLNSDGGSGGISNVVNDTGGSSTAANPDVPVDVVSYP